MTSDRFHKAAKDGYLEALKVTTRKDCNSRDEDGMTPTLWAAFEGKLEALRLLVGRGGDPDKCDNFGNTALHFAAARGHMNCVTFLVNFGANLWSLDIDEHTPKDLAAMNDREEILRFLDSVITKQESLNKKTVKHLKEKAQKDAEKRSKEFQKLQKKAEKLASKEQKRLLKERERMEKAEDSVQKQSSVARPSVGIMNLRKDSRLIYGQRPKFSDIVSTTPSANTTKKFQSGGVYKKVQQKKQTQNVQPLSGDGDFKVGATEKDGKRSVRSLSGLRRDSEVMYVPKFDPNAEKEGKRGKIANVFNSDLQNGELKKAVSEPDFLHTTDSGFAEDVLLSEPSSMFDRPGFGSVAFRKSITGFCATPKRGRDVDQDSAHASDRGSDPRSGIDDSIGSAGSLAQRNTSGPWDEEDFLSDEEEVETSPVHMFLAAAGLADFIPVFIEEEIDLEALMLLNEDHLKSMNLPMGPRRKLLKAIEERKTAIEDPGEVEDSRL